MKIKCGIFQGDTLSSFFAWYEFLYQNTGYGYKIKDKMINHLFYMGYLKLYARNDEELEGFLKTVKVVTAWNLINMQRPSSNEESFSVARI